MFTLDNFEDKIDNDFLSRGLQYFNSERILSLKETSRGKWKAIVRGNLDYRVNVLMADREIIESFCNCPYEGDYCKHEIAVFYALSGGNLKLEKTNEMPLSNMSKEQLVSLIERGRSESLEFDELITTELKMVNVDKFSKKEFKGIILDSLRCAKDRHGFIDYYQSRKATIGAEKVYEQAEDLENKNQIVSIDAYGSIIENLVPALQYADDSDGSFGELIDAAFMGLGRVAKNIKNQEVERYLFKYCLKEGLNKKYNGWQFGLEYLKIVGIFVSKGDKLKFFEALDSYIDNIESEDSSEYYAEKVALIKLSFIEKYEGQKVAEEFIQANINLNDIREEAVKRAIKENKLEDAKKMAKDGISVNKTKYPGLVHTYFEFLLEISEIENNYDSQVDLLSKLFTDDHRHDFKYFNKLKSLSRKGDWQKIIEKIKKGIDDDYALAQIYQIEEDWTGLLNTVKKSNSHYLVDQYFDLLSRLFSEELAKIYENLVYSGIEYAGGRGDYSQRARFLKVISDLGQIDRAKEIGEELKEKYKNRRAMLEEFSKLGF